MVKFEDKGENICQVCIYVDHGYYSYEVNSMDQAISHAETIMTRRTYRRVTDNKDVEILYVHKVKVKGKGLDTEYPDQFHRT